jgi:hypothetical protein
LPLRRQAGGKELPVPVAGDDLPAVARQFVGSRATICRRVWNPGGAVASSPG